MELSVGSSTLGSAEDLLAATVILADDAIQISSLSPNLFSNSAVELV